MCHLEYTLKRGNRTKVATTEKAEKRRATGDHGGRLPVKGGVGIEQFQRGPQRRQAGGKV